ncbi:hypothetical protein IC7_01407 [Bacillus cereus BAG1O-1]|uniref:hypothetical protein n=1 Tax=Bacillus wiedmannii TaxID=1890302 RepID=UPI00032D742B|nr:hypothetical protein [Bacillus wiedmannii]EOO79275.1 hypothetical protein IC7_01407 [Bacillus cereus BAG1O-1]PGD90896.1 hypothetical protein COM48_26420 [Bacillus wiedmannii]
MRKYLITSIVLLCLFVINIWMENATEKLYEKWIEPVLGYPIQFTYVLLGGAAIYTIVDLMFQNKEDKINNLEGQVQQYEEQLKEETKGLWRHFKDINKFKVQENVLEVMKTFVNNETNVIAAQLYEYTIKESSKQTAVKVSHLDGYVAEGEELNALLQEYYYLNPQMYADFKKSVFKLKKNNDTSDIMKFIDGNREVLDAKSVEELNGDMNASLVYSLTFLAVQSYIGHVMRIEKGQEQALTFTVVSEEKDEVLYNNKRNGILRTILNSVIAQGDFYIFYHNGYNEKKGRIYYTETIKVSGKKQILLITLNELALEQEDWVQYIKGVGKDFVELLKDKGLNVEYEQRN